MANSHRAPKELAELRGDLSALKLKIVLLEKQEAELGRIEQESDSDEALQMLVKSSEQKMLRYIDRSCRKDEIKRLAFRTFPQVAKVAACLLLFRADCRNCHRFYGASQTNAVHDEHRRALHILRV